MTGYSFDDLFTVDPEGKAPPTAPDDDEQPERAAQEKAQRDHEGLVDYWLTRMRAQEEAHERRRSEQADHGGGLAPDRGWLPADLGAFLDGEEQPATPELFPRDDGVCLLYRGAVHSFHGESESGKSLLAQAEAARILLAGGTVAYVDFEADVTNVGGRLLAMGVPADVLKARLLYIHPQASYEVTAEARAAFEALAARRLDLVVIDGVTDALLLFGLNGREESEFTKWFRLLPRALAERTGAAVVNVDHVTKDTEGRGRHAIGSQAKLNTLTGAAYAVTVKQALGQGMRGVVEMRVVKDRPGQVRPRCGAFRNSDRSQCAALVEFDSTDGETIKVTVRAPEANAPTTSEPATFRPTGVMEKVSRFLEGMPPGVEPTSTAIEKDVGGKATVVRAALALLVEEGYVTRTPRGQSLRHRALRPYIQKHDPLSDRYQGVEA